MKTASELYLPLGHLRRIQRILPPVSYRSIRRCLGPTYRRNTACIVTSYVSKNYILILSCVQEIKIYQMTIFSCILVYWCTGRKKEEQKPMKAKHNPNRTSTPGQIHELLCKKLLSKEYKQGVYHEDTRKQACFCPYYVPLKGTLGFDWGVIVNSTSPKFGQLVFEHDGCACPTHENQP
jgi:hypothetical protein